MTIKTFEQWWEQNGTGYSSYEDFSKRIWDAAQAAITEDAPIISVGHGASVSGMIVVQPQKKQEASK